MHACTLIIIICSCLVPNSTVYTSGEATPKFTYGPPEPLALLLDVGSLNPGANAAVTCVAVALEGGGAGPGGKGASVTS